MKQRLRSMRPTDVRFRGQSGHGDERPECPLLTQSGHERRAIVLRHGGTRTSAIVFKSAVFCVLAQARKIRMLVEHFPLERVAEAYQLLHGGKINGRAVITPNG